ncbi:TIGR03088 family PEP-CTERM/XrtA system glycosyltransferase [Pseudomaricurvus alkylphenolicus]|uniref:TIGR03088 family PEP-CTERM/XrtA system glycosyltransferase n=1 Tax=Pseudomaricurvus alkylphenolicus TaxID=1306991 RepID=UPI00141E57F7|nr:TIGR03088 family PEP-CTERM/XrtA system glycosyltransferase [Pseudomaricurvus alkylphenolicus]NIB43133.1 TIGR03088 family PEP-CTERM/XrtA system glycosyltransferase [Pseudomaricurvus alkylphenolicus]
MMASASFAPPLVVHIIYSLDTGGLENGLVNIINHMEPDAYRHKIICLGYCNPAFSERIKRDDIEIVALNKGDGFDFPMMLELRRILKRWKPAIIHSRNIAALEMQLVTLGIGSIKRIHGEHGRDIGDLNGQNWKYNALRKVSSLWVDRFITVSKDMEQWLQQDVGIPRQKLTQIYNGVDLTKFMPRETSVNTESSMPEQPPIIVGTVGRLDPVKAQNLLIDAVAKLVSLSSHNRDHLKLWIIGDGPEKQVLQAQAEQLGIGDLVWFAGDRSDVPELLQQMDIFVLPSLAEGLSNTLLESMASGKAVVASLVGGNPELIDDDVRGKTFQSRDLESLTKILQQLMNSAEERNRLGVNARKFIEERFSWSRCVQDYRSQYDALLQGRAQDKYLKEIH